MKTLHKHENLTYLALWGILFIAPLLSMYIGVMSGDIDSFRWDELFHVWQQFASFLVLFLIHNFLLAPLLIHKQRHALYIGCIVTLIALFALYQCTTHPGHRGPRPGMDGPRPPQEMHGRHQPPHMDEADQHEAFMPFDSMDEMKPMDSMEHAHDMELMEKPRQHHLHKKGPFGHRGPFMFDWHDVFSIITLILMLGMNLAVKLYFKNRHDQQQMALLEHQNLERQLEYLRYQINPHFFMNTLNNIHALVDIDSEQAKSTILELSKMMRFVLYEGNKQRVPLNSELSFLRNYITLMSLRYTDKVTISVQLPEAVSKGEVPPLLFVTFVENAFKHGISYQQQSFIEIRATLSDDDMLHFFCRNSKQQEKDAGKPGGVGLRNIRQRLDLIYGKRYSLDINDGAADYTVELKIPVK